MLERRSTTTWSPNVPGHAPVAHAVGLDRPYDEHRDRGDDIPLIMSAPVQHAPSAGHGRHAREPSHRRSRTRWSVAGALVILVLLGTLLWWAEDDPAIPPVDPADYSTGGLRAFDSESWWNTRLPVDAPRHPAGERLLTYLRTAPQSGGGYLRLAGADNDSWGQPIYWAEPGDPTYEVQSTRYSLPPEFAKLRIPRGALPGDNSDSELTVYDESRGYVAALWNADFDGETETWQAGGGSIAYLDSNGLDARTGRSDDRRNTGSFRGTNGATTAVRLDEVQTGAIRHVLKISVGPEASVRHVFPMVGSDGESRDMAAPPQGLRLRIRPDVDLAKLDLPPQALVIARALRDYGAFIGDSAGTTALKLENTVVEGRGQMWDIDESVLEGLPFTPKYWSVLPEGYDPGTEPDP